MEVKRIAIQGFRGSFHEQAARSFYGLGVGDDCPIVECYTFEGLYDALDSSAADVAVMAIENTVSGGLLPNFELLRYHRIPIKGRCSCGLSRTLWPCLGSPLRF